MAAGNTELAHKLTHKSMDNHMLGTRTWLQSPRTRPSWTWGGLTSQSTSPTLPSLMEHVELPRSQELTVTQIYTPYHLHHPGGVGRELVSWQLSDFSPKNQPLPFPSSQDHLPRFQHLQEVTHLQTERVHGRQPSEQGFHWGTHHWVTQVPCIPASWLQPDGQDRNWLLVCLPWLFIVETEWRKQKASQGPP